MVRQMNLQVHMRIWYKYGKGTAPTSLIAQASEALETLRIEFVEIQISGIWPSTISVKMSIYMLSLYYALHSLHAIKF